MSTILVVDDTPMCRELVSEILRTKGFQVLCAGDGYEALNILHESHVDLVLLDVIMPKLSGLATLEYIRSMPKWQHKPVILFTEDAKKETVRDAARHGAQDYILKASFTAEELLERINKWLPQETSSPSASQSQPTKASSDLRDDGVDRPPTDDTTSMQSTPVTGSLRLSTGLKKDKDFVLRQIRKKLDLRPVPPVLQYIISQTHSSRTSMHDVVNTIRKDQALALRTMKLANSAYYAPTQRARDLLEAAGRLGMSGIRNAVVALMSIDHFESTEESGLNRKRFWEHSLGTALLSQSIAGTLNVDAADDLFLSGLLHDTGRMLLANVFPEEFQCIITRAQKENIDLLTLEREMFGAGHDEVTHDVLSGFGLHETVVTAATLHEQSAAKLAAAGHTQGALIVALANRLAHALVFGNSGSVLLLPVHEFVSALSLRAGVISTISRDVTEKMSDTELFFTVQGGADLGRPFIDELTQSREPRKVTVIAANAPGDPLFLFFNRLGWLSDDEPEAAILSPHTKEHLEKQAADLEELEKKCGRRLDIFIAWSGPKITEAEKVLKDRPFQEFQLPLRYDALFERIAVDLCVAH